MSPPPPSTSFGPAGVAPKECPVCGLAPMRQTGHLASLPLMHCPSCGHDCLRTDVVDLSKFYPEHYAGFEADPVFHRRVREVLRDSIAPHLPPKARVLDVGCGNGEFLLAAKERGYEVLGIDFAQGAADACSRRGIRAVVGDFLKHDFGPDAPFDLITMWDVCEHLDHPLEFMTRARSLLSPTGMLVLKVPCFTPRSLWIASHIPKVSGPLIGTPGHVQYFRPPTLTRLLQRAGFSRVDVADVSAMRRQGTARSLVTGLKRRVIRDLTRLSGNKQALVRGRP